MTTLADKAILSGADNHPPMLKKDMYDSWKSIMELYMMNRQHGRMILESVENGPLIWPAIKENGVTRPRKYSELSATDAIQADCDVKATNIILQGLPPEDLQGVFRIGSIKEKGIRSSRYSMYCMIRSSMYVIVQRSSKQKGFELCDDVVSFVHGSDANATKNN
ncbi:hypothetical protein Tco_0743568 [Tanacetum coccineum]